MIREKKKIKNNSITVSQSSFLVDKSESENQRKCHDKNRNTDQTTNDEVTSTCSVNFNKPLNWVDQTLSEIICGKDGFHIIRLQLLVHCYPPIKEFLGELDLRKLYSQY